MGDGAGTSSCVVGGGGVDVDEAVCAGAYKCQKEGVASPESGVTGSVSMGAGK